MADAKTDTKLADDAIFDDLDPVPAGAVRAYGRISKDGELSFLQWQDGQVTDGTIDAQAMIEGAVKHGVEVSLPAVYTGPSSIKTKAEFMATAYGHFHDAEFSEDFPLTHDADLMAA